MIIASNMEQTGKIALSLAKMMTDFEINSLCAGL
jgi:hypothetical protein